MNTCINFKFRNFTVNFSSEQVPFPMNFQTLSENPPIPDDVLYSVSNNKIKTLIELLNQKLPANFYAVIIDFYIDYLTWKQEQFFLIWSKKKLI